MRIDFLAAPNVAYDLRGHRYAHIVTIATHPVYVCNVAYNSRDHRYAHIVTIATHPRVCM